MDNVLRFTRPQLVFVMTAAQTEEFCKHAVKAEEIDWSFR